MLSTQVPQRRGLSVRRRHPLCQPLMHAKPPGKLPHSQQRALANPPTNFPTKNTQKENLSARPPPIASSIVVVTF